MKQMTFENLRTNPTVPKADVLRLKRQAIAIYNHLKAGPMTTEQLNLIAHQYNARINELRRWLKGYGLTIDCIAHDRHGNNTYKLVPFAGSRYQAQLMARQKTKVIND